MSLTNLSPLDSLNLNISAYRVLYVLLLLVQYRGLTAAEMNRFLNENPLIERTYNAETLTKYINTLREAGCAIPRSTNRSEYAYELLRSPFPLPMPADDVAMAMRLLGVLTQHPDGALYDAFQSFLARLDWHLAEPPVSWLTTSDVDARVPVSDPGDADALQRTRQQMTQYRRYCQDAFLLRLVYDAEDVAIQIEPHEVVLQGRRLLLLGMDAHSYQPVRLDVARIRSVEQLPMKNKRAGRQVTVVFALLGRLSHSYRLYPHEKVIYRNGHELHVKARVLDVDSLLARLLKYGEACQVLSPRSLRQRVRDHVAVLLDTLNTG